MFEVIDQGSDDTTNAISIRRFFGRVSGVATTESTRDASIVQTRHRTSGNAAAGRPDHGVPGADP